MILGNVDEKTETDIGLLEDGYLADYSRKAQVIHMTDEGVWRPFGGKH